MPRPRKNTVDYFSHDKGMRNDPKVKAIRTKFGIVGYAIWCMFLEILCDSEDLEYEETDISITLIAGDFGISDAEMSNFLSFCYRINLLQLENGKIYSKNLKKRLQQVFNKRENLRKKYNLKRSSTIVSATEISQASEFQQEENTQSKVKYSTVNKSKEGRKEPLSLSDQNNETEIITQKILLWNKTFTENGIIKKISTDDIGKRGILTELIKFTLEDHSKVYEYVLTPRGWANERMRSNLTFKIVHRNFSDLLEKANIPIFDDNKLNTSSKNTTEAKHIDDHNKLIKNEAEENQRYQLSSFDEKLGIVSKLLVENHSPYLTIRRDKTHRLEVEKRVTEFIKNNITERSTVMSQVNLIVSEYMDEIK